MIRFLFTPFRWLIKLLAMLLLIAIVGVWLMLWFADHLVERELRKSTGFPVEIGTLDVRMWSTRFDLLDMELRNPAGYTETDFLHVDRFSARLRPFSLLRSEREWEDVTLYIRQLTLVQNVQGEINAEQFLRKIAERRSSSLAAIADGSVEGSIPLRIKNLKLRIGALKVVREGVDEQTSRTLNLNYEVVFEDVKNLHMLLKEMQSRMDSAAARWVVYLLFEALGQMGRMSGKGSGLADELTEQGNYLWEMGEGWTVNLKNFIEGLKE